MGGYMEESSVLDTDPDSIRSVDPYPDSEAGFGSLIRIQEGKKGFLTIFA